MAQQREYIKISGSVEDVIFKNEETGFCVLDLDIGGELVCAVGAMGAVEAGESWSLPVTMRRTACMGRSFACRCASGDYTQPPARSAGILRAAWSRALGLRPLSALWTGSATTPCA